MAARLSIDARAGPVLKRAQETGSSIHDGSPHSVPSGSSQTRCTSSPTLVRL